MVNYSPLVVLEPETHLLPRNFKNLDNTRRREYTHSELQLRTEEINLDLMFNDTTVFNIQLSYFYFLSFFYDYHTHCDECYSFDVIIFMNNVYINDDTEAGKLHPGIYIKYYLAIIKPNYDVDNHEVVAHITNTCKHAKNYPCIIILIIIVFSSIWSARASGYEVNLLIRNVRTLILYISDGLLPWVTPLLHTRSIILLFRNIIIF